MQMLNDMFTGHLSKFSAKVIDEDVFVQFTITHISKNEPDQNFLDNFAEEYASNINRCFTNPEWDNIKFSKTIPNMNIKFDGQMELVAILNNIKITQKETTKDIIFKYDMTFLKKQEKDIDTYFATYLNHKEEDEDGKKMLTEYEIEIAPRD